MSIFNKKGMMVFPNPQKHKDVCTEDELLVFTECYCSKAHSLISPKASFNNFKGILLQISKGNVTGQVALSPVYGCKTRVALGIDLEDGELYTISCPECGEALPVFTKCHCGGDIFTLFLNKEAKFDSFVGACNRIGCTNAFIQIGKELITSVRLEAL